MEAVESFVELLAENPDKDFILREDFMPWENNIVVCLSERKKDWVQNLAFSKMI